MSSLSRKYKKYFIIILFYNWLISTINAAGMTDSAEYMYTSFKIHVKFHHLELISDK